MVWAAQTVSFSAVPWTSGWSASHDGIEWGIHSVLSSDSENCPPLQAEHEASVAALPPV